MRYQVYPEYKESGVQWLGQVPGHWEVNRLKTSATYKVSNVDKVPKEDELPVRLCNYTNVYYYDHITPDMELMETTATLEEISRFHLQVDDIVITKDSEDWRDIAVPARVAETAPDLVCGYHLAIISPVIHRLDGRYLLRAFQSCAVNQQFQIAASGVTRYGLPKASIGEAELPLPPLPEQTAIANFLDRETGRIDTLVAKKRRLIALLKEKRTALISRTVTRGLPEDAAREFGLEPHTRFKDSGIEWLGEVSEGWKVKKVWIERVSRNIELQDGNHGELHPKAEDYVREGIPFVMANHIINGKVDFGKCNYIDKQQADALRIGFSHEGDVLLTHKGTIGRVGMVQESEYPYVMLTPQVTYYRCLREVHNRFLFWLMQSIFWQDQLRLLAGLGSTRAYIGLLDQKTLSFLIPDGLEQSAIATYLDLQVAEIDQLVEKVEVAIDRLQEYRTALITAAVTGKIDVREVAA